MNRPDFTVARAEVNRLVEQRRQNGEQLGFALARAATAMALSRPAIQVNPEAQVVAQITKSGLVYSFALNLEPLPFSDQNVYPLALQPGENGLVWFVAPTKSPWAYQVNLIVDGESRVLDQGSGTSSDPKPEPQQQVILVG